jgi:hypothetical protein
VLYFDDHGAYTVVGNNLNKGNPAIPYGAGSDTGCTPYVFGYKFGSLPQTRKGPVLVRRKPIRSSSRVHPQTLLQRGDGYLGTIPITGHNYGFSVSGVIGNASELLPVRLTIEPISPNPSATYTNNVPNPKDPKAQWQYENSMIGTDIYGMSCTNTPPQYWMDPEGRLGMFAVETYAAVRRFVFVEGKSRREAARVFGLSRETVAKMCRYSAPPGYVRSKEPEKPKLGPLVPVIDAILEADKTAPPKQRHTATRIFERLRIEHGFLGGYTVVKDYVRIARARSREVFVPIAHPPGHAQVDFGVAIWHWPMLGAAPSRRDFSTKTESARRKSAPRALAMAVSKTSRLSGFITGFAPGS